MRKVFGWVVVMVLALLLSGCIFQQPRPVYTLTPGPAPSATLEPGPRPSATPAPTRTDIPATAEATPPPLTAPRVINRYPLPENMLGESIEVTPGRVWVGANGGTLLEYDSGSGALISIYTLIESSYDGIAPVKDLAFDGQHLWALVSWQDSVFNQIVEILVLDPAGGRLVKRIDVTDQDPEHLGLSPGRVWAQNLVFDAVTLEESAVMMNSDATVFASDRQGSIWVGGARACDDCPTSLYRYPVEDIFNAQPGPAAGDEALHLLVARERLWVATGFNTLDAYALSPQPQVDTTPAASLDLSAEMELPPAAMIYDGTALWLLAGVGNGGGNLYQHDPDTGQRVSVVGVGDAAGEMWQAHVPVAAAFDGRDLWVLTALDLAQVGLPWTR